MATQKNFVVKNGIEITESIKLGNKTITNLLDSAAVATIARTAAFDSDGEINADPAGTAVALAIALG